MSSARTCSALLSDELSLPCCDERDACWHSMASADIASERADEETLRIRSEIALLEQRYELHLLHEALPLLKESNVPHRTHTRRLLLFVASDVCFRRARRAPSAHS